MNKRLRPVLPLLLALSAPGLAEAARSWSGTIKLPPVVFRVD